jgi:hypothetical protein
VNRLSFALVYAASLAVGCHHPLPAEALFALLAPAALAIPCSARVEGSEVLLATPLAFTTGTPTPTPEACVGGTRDGDGLYLALQGGSLSVEPDRADAGRSVLRFTPR